MSVAMHSMRTLRAEQSRAGQGIVISIVTDRTGQGVQGRPGQTTMLARACVKSPVKPIGSDTEKDAHNGVDGDKGGARHDLVIVAEAIAVPFAVLFLHAPATAMEKKTFKKRN